MSERAQFVKGSEDLFTGATVRGPAFGCRLQRDRQRDQSLLRAVVKIPLEAPTFAVADLHDACARRLQLGELSSQPGSRRRVLESQTGTARRFGESLGSAPELGGVAKIGDHLAAAHDLGHLRAGRLQLDKSAVAVDRGPVATRERDREGGIPYARSKSGT